MRRIAVLLSLIAVSACSSSSGDSADGGTAATTDAAETAPATTSVTTPDTDPGDTAEPAAPTTELSATGTTPESTDAPPVTISRLPEGYDVSDDYVVETIIDDLDQATGGLAVDSNSGDALYTSDFGYDDHVGKTITRITRDGTASVFATDDSMMSLTGSTFGPDGTLYQSGFGSGQVFAISPDGEVTVVTDQIAGPTGIVATADGRLFVDSCTDDIVYEVLGDGTAVEFVQDPLFACLNGLTQDDVGTLYAVNFESGRLFSITPDGTVTTLHEFPGANAHVAHHDGQLFITSRTKNVIYRYDLATTVADIIVGNGAEGHVDGIGSEAQVERPNAIAVGSDGTLFINHGSDRRSHPTVIRAIRPAT